MGLWNDIKEIIKDISDDVDVENKRIQQFERDTGNYRRNRSDSYGFFKQAIPNFIGFVVGLAFARLLGFSGIAVYLISGTVFAVAVGTIEHTVFGDMNLKSAVIRNIIMVSFFCLMFVIAYLIQDKPIRR